VSDAPTSSPLPFTTRLWFAWICFFRALFDGDFAARAWSVRDALPAPALPAPAKRDEPAPDKPAKPERAAPPPPPSTDAALQLLGLLQREGRLIDFLEQDVATFEDAEIGAAARAVHEGSRKALRAHVTLAPVREEEEETKVTLAEGFDAASVKLTGNVTGKPPFAGTLRHRGWRATKISLPVAVDGHDVRILCPAEVEL
jgi:Domain of unknown function (DUF2760)